MSNLIYKFDIPYFKQKSKMKKLIIVLFLLLSTNINSQELSVLWKVEKDSVESYIIGTNHLFGSNYISKDTIIINLMKNSKLIITENNESANKIFEKRSIFNYIDKLSEKEKNKLNECLGSKTNIEKLTLKELLGQTERYWGRYSCLNEIEQKDTVLMDDYIKYFAKENNIKIQGIEETSETLKSVEKFTYPSFNDNKLLTILKDKLYKFSNNIPNTNCNLENAYRNKKVIYNFNDNLKIPILYERNKEWIKSLPILLEKNKNVFIAVGIGHLNFSTGIIELLKKEGYILTPINLK